MKIHLQEYLNRIKSFSKRLDNFALLLEQPWITKIDDENSRCVFIFRRENKQLLMSVNGKIEKAKWDYIPSMNSLLIERKNETILYNQEFFDESIMILKIDGTDQYQLFANENKISSTIERLLENVENQYIQNVDVNLERINSTDKKQTLTQLYTPKGIIYCKGCKEHMNGRKVYANLQGELAADGKYEIGFMRYIHVKNGVVEKTTIL